MSPRCISKKKKRENNLKLRKNISKRRNLAKKKVTNNQINVGKKNQKYFRIK